MHLPPACSECRRLKLPVMHASLQMLPGAGLSVPFGACISMTLLPATCSTRFYPATVYLSTSKLAVALMGNFVFASALLGHSLIIKAGTGWLTCS